MIARAAVTELHVTSNSLDMAQGEKDMKGRR